YPEFQSNPALLRAHMMASAIAHDDVAGLSNAYGLGRVSGFVEHWTVPDATGWSTNWFSGTVSDTEWQYGDIVVPEGAQRLAVVPEGAQGLVVVLPWDEPAASAGALQAVPYDLDLWLDRDSSCDEPDHGACGQYSSVSTVDNVEFVVIPNPPAGTYRLKASNFS